MGRGGSALQGLSRAPVSSGPIHPPLLLSWGLGLVSALEALDLATLYIRGRHRMDGVWSKGWDLWQTAQVTLTNWQLAAVQECPRPRRHLATSGGCPYLGSCAVVVPLTQVLWWDAPGRGTMKTQFAVTVVSVIGARIRLCRGVVLPPQWIPELGRQTLRAPLTDPQAESGLMSSFEHGSGGAAAGTSEK